MVVFKRSLNCRRERATKIFMNRSYVYAEKERVSKLQFLLCLFVFPSSSTLLIMDIVEYNGDEGRERDVVTFAFFSFVGRRNKERRSLLESIFMESLWRPMKHERGCQPALICISIDSYLKRLLTWVGLVESKKLYKFASSSGLEVCEGGNLFYNKVHKPNCKKASRYIHT